MRSPRHLIISLVVLAVVVTVIGLLVPKLTGSDQPTTTGNSGGSSTSTPNQNVGGGGGQPGTNPGSGGAPTTTVSTSLPTRITQPPQTPTSAPPSPQALDVMTLWAKAWVNHPQGVTNAQWLDGLRPYTTEEQIAIMASVDPANIPATQVTGPPTPKTSYTTSVEGTVPTNGGVLTITVISTPAGWRVAKYEKA
jgi:hypothetical protein